LVESSILFNVSSSLFLVTARHVLDGLRSRYVWAQNEFVGLQGRLHFSEEFDFAFMRLDSELALSLQDYAVVQPKEVQPSASQAYGCGHGEAKPLGTEQKGIGPRFVQGLTISLGIPLLLTLATEKILTGETIAALVGSLLGIGIQKERGIKGQPERSAQAGWRGAS
jgi:hypothetical protein